MPGDATFKAKTRAMKRPSDPGNFFHPMRLTFRVFIFLFAAFIAPSLLHAAIWATKDKPGSWHTADWTSAGILPASPNRTEAAIYVMSARTGGFKGAFASHSWLVIKKPGRMDYDRYDVVGWGRPVRKNAYPADGRWYSNAPTIHHQIKGEAAKRLIAPIEREITNYRWQSYGDYTLWPGPNSNTFVATIIRNVPELKSATPSTAVGRDFPADGNWFKLDSDGIRATLGGYAGFAIGKTAGLELNFLGLVLGFNPGDGTLKVPSFGAFSLY
ncbi:MAG: DUF3750 domain-containing protein [Pseudomonadota bacterium]